MARPAHRWGTAAAAAATGLAALAFAAPSLAGAGGVIVPGRSIGPIAIGDERAAIAVRAGNGTVASRTPNPAHPGNRNLDRVVVRYPALSLVAAFATDEASSGVVRLRTRSGRYLTARGIGVGSSRRALRAAHPAAVCDDGSCRIGRALPGRVVTRLRLASGRVAEVALVRHPG